jgi:predicted O-methyltransferase YrrM
MHISKLSNFFNYIFRAKVNYPLSSTKRYGALLDIVYKYRAKTIIEIGVYTGRRAVEMITTASIRHSPKDITYIGFDLFEQMNDEIYKNELSKMPDTMDTINRKIEKTGVNIHLFKGYSEETLPRMIAKRDEFPPVDFIFIDGGHSIETISSDWENARKLMSKNTIVVFDDYYLDCPDLIDKFGCNKIIDSLDRAIYDVAFLKVIDSFDQDRGKLNIQMVRVTLRDGE